MLGRRTFVSLPQLALPHPDWRPPNRRDAKPRHQGRERPPHRSMKKAMSGSATRRSAPDSRCWSPLAAA